MSASESSHEDKEIEDPVDQSDGLKFSTPRLKNDTKMLEDGSFSDCVVICKDQTWKTHKVILSRCPYFARAFSSNSGFKEATESKITIENFEPFEVSWLLQYIYGLRIDAEESRSTSPSKSFLETCALLWGIGDFFLLPDMSQSAVTQARVRWSDFFLQSRNPSLMLKEISFLPELEAGIRAAWRPDRVANAMRDDIMVVCISIHPFVKDHASFISLLDEIPEFTSRFAKALLGWPGMPSMAARKPRGKVKCYMCGKTIFDKGVQALDEFFVGLPSSLNLWGYFSGLVCSADCLKHEAKGWDTLLRPEGPSQ